MDYYEVKGFQDTSTQCREKGVYGVTRTLVHTVVAYGHKMWRQLGGGYGKSAKNSKQNICIGVDSKQVITKPLSAILLSSIVIWAIAHHLR